MLGASERGAGAAMFAAIVTAGSVFVAARSDALTVIRPCGICAVVCAARYPITGGVTKLFVCVCVIIRFDVGA